MGLSRQKGPRITPDSAPARRPLGLSTASVELVVGGAGLLVEVLGTDRDHDPQVSTLGGEAGALEAALVVYREHDHRQARRGGGDGADRDLDDDLALEDPPGGPVGIEHMSLLSLGVEDLPDSERPGIDHLDVQPVAIEVKALGDLHSQLEGRGAIPDERRWLGTPAQRIDVMLNAVGLPHRRRRRADDRLARIGETTTEEQGDEQHDLRDVVREPDLTLPGRPPIAPGHATTPHMDRP